MVIHSVIHQQSRHLNAPLISPAPVPLTPWLVPLVPCALEICSRGVTTVGVTTVNAGAPTSAMMGNEGRCWGSRGAS